MSAIAGLLAVVAALVVGVFGGVVGGSSVGDVTAQPAGPSAPEPSLSVVPASEGPSEALATEASVTGSLEWASTTPTGSGSAARTTVGSVDPARVSPQRAAASGTADAAGDDIVQGVALVDRSTGQLVASEGGDRLFNAESIGKLFTAAFYLVLADGSPDRALAAQLRAMIEVSDNDVQSSLWREDIIPTIAERYGLTDVRNGDNPSSGTWGSDRISANDLARFLYRMSLDPLVGRQLTSWMRTTALAGTDGFDQSFGFNALTGDHGSKQGWSDPGWSPANLHSVGWTSKYFAAILQTSPTADYRTMRAASTATATLIAGACSPS